MNLNKKLIKIITIFVLIGSISLIYEFTILLTYNEKGNMNTLNEIETLMHIDAKTVSKSVPITNSQNNKIPILMYHSISYEKGNILKVSKENFRKQMKYLIDNNYTTLSLDELYSYMKTGKDLPQKPIVITFDDGYEDNFTNAYPILKEFKLKATVFVITNTIDREKNFLTSNEIKLMDASNIRIESHTTSHEHLDQILYSDTVKTMTTSKLRLEKLLNRKINYIAYPYGGYNQNTINAAKQSGYKLAFSTEYGIINRSNNIYTLGRIFVNSNLSFEEFKLKLNQ